MSEGFQELKRDGDIPSLHFALLASHDYADARKYDMEALVGIHNYWNEELASSIRSRRAKNEIPILLSRVAFEIEERWTEN